MSDEKIIINPSMGFWKTWAMVVGTIVGSGIWLAPSLLAPFGKLGLWAWAASGLGAIVIALAIGTAAKRVPKVGGCYAYTREGFGEFAAFLVAWIYWISVWIAVATIAVAFVGYAGVLIPAVTASPAASIVTGIVAIWAIAAINLRGMREMGAVQLITTVLKISPLVIIGLYGLVSVSPAAFDAYIPTSEPVIQAFSTAVVITMWAFIGLEAATVPAADVINPSKTLPRALVLGTATTALLYLFSSYAVMGLLGQDVLATSTAPYADAAATILGPVAGVIIAIFALISCFGAMNSNLCCTSQIAMAAAQDNLFPRPFARLSKNAVPAFSTIIAATLASIILATNFTRGLLAAFEFLILIATITTLLAYAFAIMSSLMFSLKDKSISTGQRLREGVVSTIAFLICIWLMAGSGFETVYWTFMLLMAGIPVYVWRKFSHTEDAAQDEPVQ